MPGIFQEHAKRLLEQENPLADSYEVGLSGDGTRNVEDIYDNNDKENKPILPRSQPPQEGYVYDEDDQTDPNTYAPGPREPTPPPFSVRDASNGPFVIDLTGDSTDEEMPELEKKPQLAIRTGGNPSLAS